MQGAKGADQPKLVMPKRKYSPPTLVKYGKLRELTTGGSGVSEGMATMNINKSNP